MRVKVILSFLTFFIVFGILQTGHLHADPPKWKMIHPVKRYNIFKKCAPDKCLNEAELKVKFCIWGKVFYTKTVDCTKNKKICDLEMGKCVFPDLDGDGVTDDLDICANTPAQTQVNDQGCPDADGDSVADEEDNCPAHLNVEQIDSDSDGQGNVCDADDDNDGLNDEVDNCSLVSNEDQLDTDGNGTGDACQNDDDSDGITDAEDNCPLISNQDQTDSDGDGTGNVCQEDDDSDGLSDNVDNCPEVANQDQADGDKDGLGDACDSCPNSIFGDADGDGVCESENIYYSKFSQLNGNTHYVATNGSNDDGDGSVGNPWQTITHAIEKVSNGDKIHIKSGTYDECFLVNKDIVIEGEAETEIWKTGDISACPVASNDFLGFSNNFSSSALIRVEDGHYLKLKSVILKSMMIGNPQIFISLSNSKLYVEDVTISNSVNYGIAGVNSEIVVRNSLFAQTLGPADIGIAVSDSRLYVDRVRFQRAASGWTEGVGYDHCIRVCGDKSTVWVQNSAFEIAKLSIASGIENLYGDSKVFSVHNFFLGPIEKTDYFAPRGCIHNDGTTYVLANTFDGCNIDIMHLSHSIYSAFNLFDGWLKYSYKMQQSNESKFAYMGTDPSFNYGYNLFHHENGKVAIYSEILKEWEDDFARLNVQNNIWWNNAKDIVNSYYIDDVLILDDDECMPMPGIVECPVAEAIEFEPVSTISPPKNFGGMQYPEYIVKELALCEFKDAIYGKGMPPITNLPDCLSDPDSDGFPLIIDNCPYVPNENLLDSDMDGIGDKCDNQ